MKKNRIVFAIWAVIFFAIIAFCLGYIIYKNVTYVGNSIGGSSNESEILFTIIRSVFNRL